MNNGNLPFYMRIIRAYSRYRQNLYTDKLLEENLIIESNSHYRSTGDNSKKQYMIIRKKDPNNGLSAYILSNLVSIDYAIRKGMIPVVDMRSYKTPYVSEDEIGKINAWELFFKQPMGVGLEEVDSKYVHIEDSSDSGNYQKLGTKKLAFLDGSDYNIHYWKKIFAEYIRPNDFVRDRFESRKLALFGDRSGIIGILGRGTDYSSLKPKGHAVQPDVDMLISEAKAMMERHGCGYVFLATEDPSIYRSFSEVFGDKLIVNYVPNIEYNGGWLNENYSESSDKSSLRDRIGTDYLINLMLLSQCDNFVSGITGGTAVVMLMDNRFKDAHIFDLGQY